MSVLENILKKIERIERRLQLLDRKDVPPSMVFCGYDGTGGVSMTAFSTTINIDTTIWADDNYSLSADVITIALGGLYRFDFNLTCEEPGTPGGKGDSLIAWLEYNSGGGYTTIPGSLSGSTISHGDRIQVVSSTVFEVTAGDLIRLRAAQLATVNDNLVTLQNQTSLIIQRLK